MKTALVLGTLSLAIGAGCAGNDQTLVIDRFIHLSEMQMCVGDATSGFSLSKGVFDVAVYNGLGTSSDPNTAGAPISPGYFAAPVVRNGLIERATGATEERDNIELVRFDVELRAETGPTPGQLSPSRFSVTVGQQVIPPAQGKAVSIVEIIPGAQAVQLNDAGFNGTLLAHMRAVGTRAEGEITSEYVDFPVQICQNCLGSTNVKCPATGFPMTSIDLGGCYPWADDGITCCCYKFDGNGACTPGNLACGKAVPQSTM
jgi:hypothetical protein